MKIQNVLLVVGILSGLLMLTLDRPVIDWLNAHQPDWLYHGFGHITRWGEATRYYIAFAVTLALSQCAIWFKIPQKMATIAHLPENLSTRVTRLRNTSLLTLISLLTSGLLVNALKIIMGRHRPVHWLRDGVYGFEPFHGLMHNVNSFPSGHSQVAGCVTMALCLFVPRFKWLWLTLGSLIVVSRVIELDHYPSDVLAGAALGAGITFLIFQGSQRIRWQSFRWT